MNRVWHVYFLFLFQANKNKYFVPILRNGDSWTGYVINSNKTNLQERSLELQRCVVVLSSHLNQFLTHDSFVAINQHLTVTESQLATAELVGRLHRDSCAELCAAIDACEALKPRSKRMMLEAAGC